MAKEKYTFKDWKNGQIPSPTLKDLKDEANTLYYWTYISDPPRIKESEFLKIREKQKEVYFGLIEEKVSELEKNFMLEWLKLNERDRRELMKFEIEKIKEQLNNYDLLTKVKLGKWKKDAVTPKVYATYHKMKSSSDDKSENTNMNVEYVSRHEDIYGEEFYSENPTLEERLREYDLDLGKLFQTHVNYKYLKLLRGLQEYFREDYIEKSKDESLIYSKKDIQFQKYKNILNSAESIPLGKIKFIRHVKDKFELRTDKQALDKAKELYNKMYDGKKTLYKNLASYQVSKSKYHNK